VSVGSANAGATAKLVKNILALKKSISLLHLAPTLLAIARVESPSSFRGRSHWDQVHERIESCEVAISESVANCTNPFQTQNRFGSRALAVRESRFKLTLDFSTASEGLYDLDADPGEQKPLLEGAEKPVRRRLLERAREHLRQSTADRDPLTRARSQLRDLRVGDLHLGDRRLGNHRLTDPGSADLARAI